MRPGAAAVPVQIAGAGVDQQITLQQGVVAVGAPVGVARGGRRGVVVVDAVAGIALRARCADRACCTCGALQALFALWSRWADRARRAGVASRPSLALRSDRTLPQVDQLRPRTAAVPVQIARAGVDQQIALQQSGIAVGAPIGVARGRRAGVVMVDAVARIAFRSLRTRCARRAGRSGGACRARWA